MRTKHIELKDVQEKSKRAQKSPPTGKRPPNINGYNLSTTQLHQLLSGDQLSTSNDPFDKAVQKQQQLLTICNLLDRQNNIHREIDELLHSANGADWLDKQISEFKSHCPTEILLALLHNAGNKSSLIENAAIINQHFFSLIHEHLLTPLSTVAKLQHNELTQYERQDWYEWCLNFQNEFEHIKQQICTARNFFTMKTFDKISELSKDKNTRQQIGNMKSLFQSNNLVKHDVEYS